MIVHRVIETDSAVGDEPQNGGRGDEHGDRIRRELVASFQRLAAVQIRPSPGGRPHRGMRAAAGEDQADQAEFGKRLVRHPGHRGGNVAGGAGGRRRGARVGDFRAEAVEPQASEPVRRLGLDRRVDLKTPAQLGPGLQRPVEGDDEFLTETLRLPGQRRDQVAWWNLAQETVVEVLSHLFIRRSHPRRAVGTSEAGDHPAQLFDRVPGRTRLALEKLLERGPAGQAVLTGDSQLGLVQGGKLARGHAALRLKSQVPEAGPVRERTGWLGHGSPSLRPGIRDIGQERQPLISNYAAGELEACPRIQRQPGLPPPTILRGRPAVGLCRLLSETVLGDELLIPAGARLRDAGLSAEFDVHETEPAAVPVGPLEVVQQ